MATTILGSDFSTDEQGNSATWTLDYDGVSTVGITVDSTGTLATLLVFVTRVSNGLQEWVDCVNGPAGTRDTSPNGTPVPGGVRPNGTFLLGPISGTGRQVLLGPGSIIGLTSSVPPSEVPAHVKGQVYPFLFGDIWHP